MTDNANRQFSLIWGAVAVVLLALLPAARFFARFSPGCWFKSLSGIPCPTCGMTRAVVALSHLNIAGALVLNPLGTLTVAAFVAGGFIFGIRALTGRPWQVPEPRGAAIRPVAVLLIAANWIYLIHAGR